MGKFKRDYKEVDRDREAGYSGEVPKPGMYDFKLVSVGDHTSGAGNEGTEWIFECTEPPYEGWRGWVYTNDDTAAWKEVQILEALGIITKEDQTLNTTHEGILKKGNPVRCKVTNETYEEEKRGKIKTVLPMPDGGGSAKKSKKKKGSKSKEESPF
jgi:hypothetical protein